MINLLKRIDNPYKFDKKQKANIFEKEFINLLKFHIKNNKKYKKFLKYFKNNLDKIENVQPLPVRIFKDLDLKTENKIFIKELNSSGTAGSKSKIFLDKENAYNQILVLTKIMQQFLGKERLPMLIIDKKPNQLKKDAIGASIAAINGFSIFGKDHTFAINKDDSLNIENIKFFLQKYKNQKKLIFGFTFNIYKLLFANKITQKLNFADSTLLHGGGWKKLEQKMINNIEFIKIAKEKLKFERVINYYGLVEQTGSIFVECEKCNNFLTSVYSEIFVVNKDFKKLDKGEVGYLQLLSLLPTSYPGHNILTEDLAKICGEDDCKCGKKGKYFKVLGRIKKAEIRGCSDAKI